MSRWVDFVCFLLVQHLSVGGEQSLEFRSRPLSPAHLDWPSPFPVAVLTGPRKDWMTGQSLFGEMKGGTVTQVSTGLARRLLDPSCALLSGLGAGLPFEVAVGMNGLVWVAANQASHTVAIISAMQRAEHLDEAQCTALAEKLVARVAS